MCKTQHLDMIEPSSCTLNYCNLRRKVGRSPTFPTPGPTNSLGTCLFLYNGVFMTFMLICHDPSTLRPPGRECWCICNDFFQVHAKFHDCVQVMSSCHVFAFLWEFAKNSHFYKFYHGCQAFGLHQSSCDAGHLASMDNCIFSISMWFCMSLELELEMELEMDVLYGPFYHIVVEMGVWTRH